MPTATRPRQMPARVDRGRRHSTASVTASAMSTEEFLGYLRRHPATSGLGRTLAAALDTAAAR